MCVRARARACVCMRVCGTKLFSSTELYGYTCARVSRIKCNIICYGLCRKRRSPPWRNTIKCPLIPSTVPLFVSRETVVVLSSTMTGRRNVSIRDPNSRNLRHIGTFSDGRASEYARSRIVIYYRRACVRVHTYTHVRVYIYI